MLETASQFLLHSSIQDNEVHNNEVQDNEVQDNEVQDSEVQDSEEDGSESLQLPHRWQLREISTQAS